MSVPTIPRQQAAAPYQQTVAEALAVLNTDARCGLSDAEADARLERDGPNELTAEKPPPRAGIGC